MFAQSRRRLPEGAGPNGGTCKPPPPLNGSRALNRKIQIIRSGVMNAGKNSTVARRDNCAFPAFADAEFAANILPVGQSLRKPSRCNAGFVWHFLLPFHLSVASHPGFLSFR
ncbi:MAG: hypothetical protein DHS20C03_08830 [Minwuia thermotolerans]|nr:MAG: hypothetical protein DHS20C03_08830 [Minwuia thermotolerans]